MSQEDTPAEGSTPDAPEAKSDDNVGNAPKVFDEAYVKELRAEAAKNRKVAQEAQAKVEEFESANQSELEKLTGKLTKEEAARKAAETRLLRFEVAAEKEVPADALDFLVGDTREELEAKADKLLELVKSRNETNSQPDFDGGPREPTDDPKPPDQAHNDFITKLLAGDSVTT
jgi:NADPH-dependent glutamate synthase beta subunit-like oxidoreductase